MTMENYPTAADLILERIILIDTKDFNDIVSRYDLPTLERLLKRLFSNKQYYEKNLTIFPKYNKNGQPSYVYKDTEEKLTSIKEKGRIVAELINSKKQQQ